MLRDIERTHSEFLTRTAMIRRWLMLQGDGDDGKLSEETAAHVRAWAIVWMSAVAESFWLPFLRAVCEEFAQSSSISHRRKMRAQSIFFMDRIFSNVTNDLDRRWRKSFDLMDAIVLADRKSAKITVPYDGKTLRPVHLDLFWEMFQLPGAPFPSMIHRQSLETMANDRNSVAHGEQLPLTLGRLRAKSDVTATLSRLEETAENIYVHVRSMFGV